MSWRPGAIALARAANALFFFAVAAYCFLACSPFAYDQFIKPAVVPALTDFLVVSPWLFWAVLLTTILTVMPQLRGGRGHRHAWSYVAAGLVSGIVVMAHPPLARVGHSPAALALGIAALVPPVWLAWIDHFVWPQRTASAIDLDHALRTTVLAALIAWTVYSMAVPIRIAQAQGIEWSGRLIAIGLVSALILNLYVFLAIFLAIAAVVGVSRLSQADPGVEYWLLVGLLAVCATLVLYLLVCASIAFTGRDAWICSCALGAAGATVWAGIARLLSVTGRQVSVADRTSDTSQFDVTESTASIDVLELFCAPLVSVGSRRVAWIMLFALPFIAYALVDAVRQFDWNFLLQKLGVLVVWLIAFATASAIAAAPVASLRAVRWPAPVGVLLLYQAFTWWNPGMAIDRYAAADTSVRLMRDARMAHSSETAEYYRYLHANTLLAPGQLQTGDVDFVPGLSPAGRRPHIFLIIVDSMRRDYLSPYNPRVTFTPRIGELAAESYVFERAFSRYSGTALAIPSIWAGGMVPHMLEQPAFLRRNTLLKLLEANGYLRVMDIDHIVEGLVPHVGNLIQLDRGKGTMDVDVCGTVDQLERTVHENRQRPMFFYSLPQNVHIAVATQRKVPAGESYPAAFYDRIASSLNRVDACIGRFIDFLKRENLYDDSIVVLTADHGDSLGEEGRWGHAYFMYPEVMNIPLIVHLPSWIRARVRTDLDAVVFSTDITPTLYELLGYRPRDLGPLFGRPMFTLRESDVNLRRGDVFLLASSYGAVYGVLAQNGRRMYVVDAVDGREYAFDLSRTVEAVSVTPAMTRVNRRLIDEQLRAVASVYRYHVGATE